MNPHEKNDIDIGEIKNHWPEGIDEKQNLRTIRAICHSRFFVAVGLPTGCGRSTDGEPYYNLTVQNLSGNSIFTVTLSFSDYEWDVGDLGLGITKTQVGCMEPPPSTLTLSWAVSGGEPQQRKIILTEFLPADFEGEITVQMNPEGNVILNVEHKER